ncbi:hypothetical protein BH11PAT2_BH11PAT2_03960 [soil metagenome]
MLELGIVAVTADGIHMLVFGRRCPGAGRTRVVPVVDEHLGRFGGGGVLIIADRHRIAAPVVADAIDVLVEAEHESNGEVGAIELTHGIFP